MSTVSQSNDSQHAFPLILQWTQKVILQTLFILVPIAIYYLFNYFGDFPQGNTKLAQKYITLGLNQLH